MRYDVIIANPPYGKIGNEITKAIVDNIDYGTFVNLLPANDYRKNKDNALWQFVDINSMKTIQQGAFKDAYVTTMICRINKERSYYISEDEFEIENYGDNSLKKYFYENRKRHHYAFDKAVNGMQLNDFEKVKLENSIYLGGRDMGRKHLPYCMDSIGNRYNLGKLDKEGLLQETSKSMRSYNRVGDCFIIEFNTPAERKNIVDFMYSDDGFRFFAKLFTALNTDRSVKLSKVFPCVDWRKSWTVESILKDYSYTPSEIEDVVADLANFKGMDCRTLSENTSRKRSWKRKE